MRGSSSGAASSGSQSGARALRRPAPGSVALAGERRTQGEPAVGALGGVDGLARRDERAARGLAHRVGQRQRTSPTPRPTLQCPSRPNASTRSSA